jgi:hypothetical protein
VETPGFHPQNRLSEPGSRKKLWLRQKISSSGRFVNVQHFMEALSLFFYLAVEFMPFLANIVVVVQVYKVDLELIGINLL